MKLYRTEQGTVVEEAGRFYEVEGEEWDGLVNRAGLAGWLRGRLASWREVAAVEGVRAPAGSQEVWAAGVTYLRSREARMDESGKAGGASFYDRVYEAERPELFFKCAGYRVVGPGGTVRLRRDSQWQVPEPELAVLISASGEIVGYTCGNDMSCRDIEGENPLYLPQAKLYDGACALGPAVLLAEGELARTTEIRLEVRRGGATAFAGKTSLKQMKRTLGELRDWLRRELSFPAGCWLLTGTGVVPPGDFTLHEGDEVRMEIEGIGELRNGVGR